MGCINRISNKTWPVSRRIIYTSQGRVLVLAYVSLWQSFPAAGVYVWLHSKHRPPAGWWANKQEFDQVHSSSNNEIQRDIIPGNYPWRPTAWCIKIMCLSYLLSPFAVTLLIMRASVRCQSQRQTYDAINFAGITYHFIYDKKYGCHGSLWMYYQSNNHTKRAPRVRRCVGIRSWEAVLPLYANSSWLWMIRSTSVEWVSAYPPTTPLKANGRQAPSKHISPRRYSTFLSSLTEKPFLVFCASRSVGNQLT